MEGQSSDKPSMSILDKFRQLSKEKEQELNKTKTSKPNDAIGAVYLKKSFPDKHRWNNHRRGNSHYGHHGTKRKFDNDQVPPAKRRPTDKNYVGQHVGLKELDAGISEYISPSSGFSGIIKQRFSDFQVNEISEDGTVIKLTSQVIPSLEDEEGEVNFEDDELLKILPKQNWDKLYSIVEREDTKEVVEIEVTDMSKEERIIIHKTIKKIFKDKIGSNTVDVNNKKMLQINYVNGNSKFNNNSRSQWRNREFLHFVLYKENIDTTDAVHLLSHKLQKKHNDITFCGTKDKRATTTQLVCIKRVSAEKVQQIQPLRGIVLGNYEYKRNPLKLGQLSGNRFRIALRSLEVENESIVKEAVESVKTKGFLNYFGLQRFGSSVIVPTHTIGKALIHKDWKQVIELILKPRPGERSSVEVAEARKTWLKTGDAKKAMKCFHWKNTSLEHKLLQGLARTGPNDYLNALGNLPRNTLLFYGHAYQSLIWNKVISRRVKEYGLTPLPGDIVLLEKVNDNDVNNKVNEETTSTEETVDQSSADDGENSDNVAKSTDSTREYTDEFSLPCKRCNIKVLTEDEAKEAKIEDIVYPLPGNDISYPKNKIADWYKEFLDEDGITFDMLAELKRYSNIFTVYGTYRKILEKPDGLSWSILTYPEENSDLLISDNDIMKGFKPIESCPDGKLKALVLEFSLSPCTYATMLLRELMKCETASSFQANLTSHRLLNNAEINDTESHEVQDNSVSTSV